MRTALAFGAILLAGSGLNGQTAVERVTVADSDTPPWMLGWSPLRPLADHPRLLPRAPALPRLLVATQPQIGLAWTAGSPAGLAFEVPGSRSELRVAGGEEDGSYRRPLDDREAGLVQLVGLGWQPLGQGAAAGHVLFDKEWAKPASLVDLVEGYPSNPLVVTDTSVPDMGRVRAKLEGALGWRFGKWGLGLSAGVEVRDNRSSDARFPRIDRMSTPAVAVGVIRELPLDLALAAQFRWVGSRESLRLTASPGTGVVYQLEGYSEPAPRAVVPPQLFYLRVMERDALSGGLALNGRLWGADWIVYWELTSRNEAHSSAQIADPPSDQWDANGRVLGGAVQARLFGERVLLTGHVRDSRLEGDATRFDLVGTIFRAKENVLLATADVRYLPPGSPWSAGLVLTFLGESRLRSDYIAEVRTDIESWTPGVGIEVARAFGRTAVSAGYGISLYSAASTIPNPELMGPIYQRLVAPELSLYATRAMAQKAAAALRHQIGARTALLLHGQYESLSGVDSGSPLAFSPTGRRRLWKVSLALIME